MVQNLGLNRAGGVRTGPGPALTALAGQLPVPVQAGSVLGVQTAVLAAHPYQATSQPAAVRRHISTTSLQLGSTAAAIGLAGQCCG